MVSRYRQQVLARCHRTITVPGLLGTLSLSMQTLNWWSNRLGSFLGWVTPWIPKRDLRATT